MKSVMPSHAAAGVGLLIFVVLFPWQMRTGDPRSPSPSSRRSSLRALPGGEFSSYCAARTSNDLLT